MAPCTIAGRDDRRGGRASARNSVLPSAVSCIGSVGLTTPTLASWPFSLETVPSPAMRDLRVGGRELDALAVAVQHRIAGTVRQRAVGMQTEAAVAGQPRAARRLHGEVAVAAQGKVERVAGVRQRAGLLLAPGGAVLGVGDGAAALWRGALLRAEPVAELHALGLEARRVGVGDVVGDHVHGALLRDQAGGGDVGGDVHGGDPSWVRR